MAPDFFADGEVAQNEGDQLVVQTDDGRTLTLSVSPRTTWQKDGKTATRADVQPRMVVHLEAVEDAEANLAAATVNVTAEKQLRTRPQPSPDVAQKPATQQSDNTQAPDPTALGKPPDDPDRPILRRGKPKDRPARQTDSDEQPKPVAATQSATSRPPAKAAPKDGVTEFTIDDPTPERHLSSGTPTLITQTVGWVETYANGLPNYVCDQLTTRYAAENKPENWQPVDVITAKLVYDNGHENYRDITVGGKRTNKSMLELGGATSTGEFAATLRDLFSPGTMTQFQLNRTSTIGTTPVSVYDFSVDLPHSHWSIKVGGQLLRPAFSGKVWIEKSSGAVRKIEMQADNVPQNFPMRVIYSSVAYDPVRLETREFLLPVAAVNQSCARKSGACFRNDIEWRNYHKYAGESTITYQ